MNKALTVSDEDFDNYWRTLYGEIRGYPVNDIIAVAWCIRNRVEIDLHKDGKADWWGEGFTGVTRKPYQFSCWNMTDPNRQKIIHVLPTDAHARIAQLVAGAVLSGTMPDPTDGCTHYYNPSVVDEPKWARGKQMHRRIGPHNFYRDIN